MLLRACFLMLTISALSLQQEEALYSKSALFGSTDVKGRAFTDVELSPDFSLRQIRFREGAPNSCFVYFNDTEMYIEDESSIDSTIEVTDEGTIVAVQIVGLEGLHTYSGDLRFSVTSPSFTTSVLIDRRCDLEENFNLTTLSDEGKPLPCPLVGDGVYAPEEPLKRFSGEEAAGIWRLTVEDLSYLDDGSLLKWGIRICTSTNPVVSVQTCYQKLTDDGENWDNTKPLMCNEVHGCASGECGALNAVFELTSPLERITAVKYEEDITDAINFLQLNTSFGREFTVGQQPNNNTSELHHINNTEFVGFYGIETNSSLAALGLIWRETLCLNNGTQYDVSRCSCEYPYAGFRCHLTYEETLCSITISTDTPIYITDNSTTYATITLNDPRNITLIEIMKLKVIHSWTEDLTLTLLSPSNESVLLLDAPCGNQDDLIIDKLSDNGSPFECPQKLYSSYQSVESLSAFNGMAANGVWTLAISDSNYLDDGILEQWGIRVCVERSSATTGEVTSGSTFEATSTGDATTTTTTGSEITTGSSAATTGEDEVIISTAAVNIVSTRHLALTSLVLLLAILY